MKWSVISVLVMACQIDSPDSSTVQASGDSVQAVEIVAENSYAKIEITSDAPLMAGEKGKLQIKFTALKNLQAKTKRIANDRSGGAEADEQPSTYQQRPVIRLTYVEPDRAWRPEIVSVEADDPNQYVHSASSHRVTLNNMEANSTFTLNYEVTAKRDFVINAELQIDDETEKFKFGEGYGYSNLEIEVGGTHTDPIDPDDYATVEITKNVAYVHDRPKPAVKIKVTPKENASQIETVETIFLNKNSTGYEGRSPATCSGVGDKTCGDGTTLDNSFAGGNGLTILHPLTPNSNDSTTAEVEVKFHLDDKREVVAGSETLSWTPEEAEKILDSEGGAPAASSLQGGSSEGVMVHNHQKIAKINFTAENHQISDDGAPRLKVTLTALRDYDSKWNALKEGARLHLTFPVRYAFEGYELNGSKVKQKYPRPTGGGDRRPRTPLWPPLRRFSGAGYFGI